MPNQLYLSVEQGACSSLAAESAEGLPKSCKLWEINFGLQAGRTSAF